MKKVDYYRVQVTYSGRYSDYTKEELIDLALARADRGLTDLHTKTEVMEDYRARLLDGKFFVEDRFPCNKIAEVRWAYIREED